MSTSMNFETDYELAGLRKVFEELNLDCPEGDKMRTEVFSKPTTIEISVADYLVKWEISKKMGTVTKLKNDYSNLEDWASELLSKLSPGFLRQIVRHPTLLNSTLPSLGAEIRSEDIPFYWYNFAHGVSEIIYDCTVSPNTLTASQRELTVSALILELKKSNAGSIRQQGFDRILSHLRYNGGPDPRALTKHARDFWRWLEINYPEQDDFICKIFPFYSYYLDTYGKVSSMGKLRTMIEDYLYDDSAERPKIIKLVDDWLTNSSTFVEDKVPTGPKTALVSVSGTRSSKSVLASKSPTECPGTSLGSSTLPRHRCPQLC